MASKVKQIYAGCKSADLQKLISITVDSSLRFKKKVTAFIKIFFSRKVFFLYITLRTNRLRRFGHVCRSEGWIKRCTQQEVDGKREHGRPTNIWQQGVNYYLKSLKLSKDLTSNRNAWREALRMAKCPTRKTCGTWAQSG